VELQQSLSALAAAVIIILSASLSPTEAHAAIGRVTEQTGPTEIVRDRHSIPSAVNSAVEMNDTIVTARSRAQLTFQDDTTVKITEQSKLIIDDFVYDPKAGTGKLAMKVALGTARYASGQIAKNSPQSVAIKTPTATVAVRGTDFSMTVDELGRSLIMLLPSCNEKGCVTGQIDVSNEAGTITLDQAYQATLVSSLNKLPSTPMTVIIDQMNINNMLIISPPRRADDINQKSQENQTALDFNFLDQDFLGVNALDENDLNKFNVLDRNYLDNDLLGNLLDFANLALVASQEQMLMVNTMLPKYSAETKLTWRVDDQERLILERITDHVAQVIVPKEQDAVLHLTQSGVYVYQQINQGGSTTITINQR